MIIKCIKYELKIFDYRNGIIVDYLELNNEYGMILISK